MRPYLLALLLALTGLFVTAAPASALPGSCVFTDYTSLTRVGGTCTTGTGEFRVKAKFLIPSGDYVWKSGAWVGVGGTSTAIRNPGEWVVAVFEKR